MSLRQRLQHETAEIHALLDARASERGWFDGLARYCDWLRGMHAFHRQIEGELYGIDLRGLRDEGRVERLAQDMRDFGVEPLGHRPECRLGICTRDTALGVLYVTEGAKLGARVLVKRAAALHCHSSHGARFLAAEAQGFATWHAILAELESAALDVNETSRLVSAGVRTFHLAVEYLDGAHNK